ncbi:AAA family ATPase [Aerosakkonemataceae cyanobacterium BLCC-F50]|uniref:AAA family ATPase n=1 Tax=Floridaenema flaviceps BLCC-F50 TaxID=3153642 RepID=A0ABV4Y0Q8_9CYAN
MRANPGGEIAPSEVFGRDKLIQRLWRILERQSLVLSAERRMGKTSILKKMRAEAPADKLPVYRDLEKVRSPLEFAQTIFDDVENYLSGSQRTAQKARQWLKNLTGFEIGGLVKFPDNVADQWKALLTKTIEDLVENQQDRKVIFLWDEMPLMLDNIKKKEGENAAMEVLDTLRSLRQTHSELRMVYTGSIGLHNVLTALKRAGYINRPTNDMKTVDVPPLSADDADELARRLLEGEGIQTEEPQLTSQAIANSVDGIPYFIHHIVDHLVAEDLEANPAIVDEIVNSYLVDPQDPWDLRYYRERINNYYTDEEKQLVLNLLDILAVTDQPLPFDELFNRLESQLVNVDREKTRDVLTLIQQDHYINLQSNGYYFRFSVIQSWWKKQRC